jgi:hypothetical protein
LSTSLACFNKLALLNGHPPRKPLGLHMSRGQHYGTLRLHS